MEAVGDASRGCGRVRRVLACGADAEAGAGGGDDFAILGDVRANVLFAARSDVVKPDDGVGSETGVTPVPGIDGLVYGFMAPVLEGMGQDNSPISRFYGLTLSWYPGPVKCSLEPNRVKSTDASASGTALAHPKSGLRLYDLPATSAAVEHGKCAGATCGKWSACSSGGGAASDLLIAVR